MSDGGESNPGMDDAALEAARREYDTAYPMYGAFSDSLLVLVRQMCRNADLAVDQVTARAKDATSVVKKIRTRGYDTLDRVTDKVGVRVITRYASTVTRVVDLLQREFDVVEVVEHGSQSPETFGYASSHVLLRLGETRRTLAEWTEFNGLLAEVQVRSILQHAWASISHSLDYKSESEVPVVVRRRLHRVAALLETGDEIFDTYRSEVEDLRTEYLQAARAGDWRDLPLDLESLEASFMEFPWKRIEDAAIAAGWRPPDDPAAFVSPTTPRARRSLGDLLILAQHTGHTTVGDLAKYADDEKALLDRLKRIAMRFTAAGPYLPYHGRGIDALAIMIIEEFRQRFVHRPPEVDATFTPWVWKGVLHDLA